MGTWQSAISVNCCASKRDDELDELSDDEREGEEKKEAAAVCVSQSWDSRPRTPSSNAPISFPRSVSNATTIPCQLKK